MQLRKYRWSKHYESAEEELVDLLAAKRIDATRWAVEPMDVLAPQTKQYDKQVWCAEGSIIYMVNGNERFSLQPGDTLEIPANSMHEATAGMAGCVCYEWPSAENTTAD